MNTSTRVLRAALIDRGAQISDAALSDHGLNDEVYDLYNKARPSVPQKAMLIARLHGLLNEDGGIERVEEAVRSGTLRKLLGREFAWVLPLLEAEQ